MTAQAIASKFRRALRNGTNMHFTADEVKEVCEFGALVPFGLYPSDYVPPLPPLIGDWPKHAVVYFLGPAEGPVKIGFSTNLRKRFRHIKYSGPQPFHIWAHTPGSVALEAEYHERFKSCRLHGEWFERSDDLETELRRIRSQQ